MSHNKALVNDREHLEETHKRWIKNIHWDRYGSNAREDWQGKQCLTCRYFIPLSGIFGDDYGVCSNVASPLDGTVRFEHDGCDEYSENEDYWNS
jgi:hypothetical protein